MKSIEEIKKDYNLFIEIQTGKYLKQVKKTEFSNEAEAKLIMEKILDTYNEKVASDHPRLDNLDKQAKTVWFNSIEIDFTRNPEDEKYYEAPPLDLKKVLEHIGERFPFLPRGSASALIFSGPAIEAYGLPIKRFETLISGEDEPTEIEEDLLHWAVEVTMHIMGSVFEKSKAKRETNLEIAMIIAQKELDTKEAVKVVVKISLNIFEMESLSKEGKQKQKKK